MYPTCTVYGIAVTWDKWKSCGVFIICSILIENEIDWIPNEWFDLPNLEYM